MSCIIYQIPVPGIASSLPYGCQEHIACQNIEYTNNYVLYPNKLLDNNDGQ